MQKTKQHYIQKAYLKGFSPYYYNFSQKWEQEEIYILFKNEKRIDKTTVDKIAYRKNYYSFFDKQYVLVTDVEDLFSSLENQFIRFREQLRTVIENLNKTGEVNNLNEKYRTSICEYVKLNLIRIPKIMDWVYQETKKKHEDKMSIKLGIPFNEYHYKNLSIKTLLEFLMPKELDVSNVLFDKDISFEYFGRTKGSLVTSDNPVIRFNEYKKPGIIFPDTHIIFPIDRNKFIRFYKTDGTDKILKISNYDVINEINDFEYENAVNEIYGPSREILEGIMKRGESRRTTAST